MTNQKLIDYIRKMLGQGASKDQIKENLTKIGWQEKDIEENFSAAFSEKAAFNPATTPPLGSEPQSLSPTSTQPTMTGATLASATTILGETWDIYKKLFKTFIGIAMLPFIVSIVFILILFGLSYVADKFIGGGALMVLFSIIYSITYALVITCSSIAFVIVVKNRTENIGVKEALVLSFKKIFSYWWISFLVTIIMIGAYIPLIIPGMIVGVWVSLAIYIMIDEDIKGLKALLKSKEYIRGYWGAIAWRFGFLILVFMIIGIPILLILTLLLGGFNTPLSNGSSLATGENLINALIFIIFTPLGTTYGYLVYSKLKAIKGQFEFTPLKKTKVTFVLLAIWGVLSSIILFGIIIVSLMFAMIALSGSSKLNFEIAYVRLSLESYYAEYDSYPSSLDELIPEYLDEIPIDPKTNQPYQYQVLDDDQSYELCFETESGQQCLGSYLDTENNLFGAKLYNRLNIFKRLNPLSN